MYLSVKVLDNKILNIIIKISQIENYHLLFLRNKLKICKKVILNEYKSSKAIDKIKFLYDERNIENNIYNNNNILNKQTTNNNDFIKFTTNKDKITKESESFLQKKSLLSNKINNENNPNDSNQDLINKSIIKNKNSIILKTDNNENNNIKKVKKNSIELILSTNNFNNQKRSSLKGFTILNTLKENEEKIIKIPHYLIKNNKEIKFKNLFKRNLNLSRLILFFIIVYSLFIGICLPYVIKYFKNIKDKMNGLIISDDLQFLLFNYYLLNRYSILMNTTKFYEKISLPGLESHLYSNYSELMKILIRDKSEKYNELIEKLDSSDKIHIGHICYSLYGFGELYIVNYHH